MIFLDVGLTSVSFVPGNSLCVVRYALDEVAITPSCAALLDMGSISEMALLFRHLRIL